MTMSRLIVKALLQDIISPNISISRTFSVVEIKGHNLNSLKRNITDVIQIVRQDEARSAPKLFLQHP